VRADLPTGTVTFLFTDIEGSTRLIEDLGEDGYVDALAAHPNKGRIRVASGSFRIAPDVLLRDPVRHERTHQHTGERSGEAT
jgi:hypothetical protein